MPNEPSSVAISSSSLTLLHVLGHDEQAFGPGADDGDDVVAGVVHAFGDGEQGCHADSAANADHGAELLDVGRFAKRTAQVLQLVSDAHGAHVIGGDAHFLPNQRYGPLFRVLVRHGQRNSFSFFVGPQDDELARLMSPGNVGSGDHRPVHAWADPLFVKDLKHLPNLLGYSTGDSSVKSVSWNGHDLKNRNHTLYQIADSGAIKFHPELKPFSYGKGRGNAECLSYRREREEPNQLSLCDLSGESCRLLC